MVERVTSEDVGDVSDYALPVGVILAGAVLPGVRVHDVDLALGVGEAQETAREDGNGVIPGRPLGLIMRSRGYPVKASHSLVGDTVHDGPSVDKVNEGLVTHARGAVGDSAEADTGGKVDGEVGSRDDGNRAAERVASDGDLGRAVLGDA